MQKQISLISMETYDGKVLFLFYICTSQHPVYQNTLPHPWATLESSLIASFNFTLLLGSGLQVEESLQLLHSILWASHRVSDGP